MHHGFATKNNNKKLNVSGSNVSAGIRRARKWIEGHCFQFSHGIKKKKSHGGETNHFNSELLFWCSWSALMQWPILLQQCCAEKRNFEKKEGLKGQLWDKCVYLSNSGVTPCVYGFSLRAWPKEAQVHFPDIKTKENRTIELWKNNKREPSSCDLSLRMLAGPFWFTKDCGERRILPFLIRGGANDANGRKRI